MVLCWDEYRREFMLLLNYFWPKPLFSRTKRYSLASVLNGTDVKEKKSGYKAVITCNRMCQIQLWLDTEVQNKENVYCYILFLENVFVFEGFIVLGIYSSTH